MCPCDETEAFRVAPSPPRADHFGPRIRREIGVTVIAAKTPTRASLALWQGARAVGEAALPLGTPDAEGQLQHVSQLPLANLPPGEYTLAVTIMSGGHSETRRATFRLIE